MHDVVPKLTLLFSISGQTDNKIKTSLPVVQALDASHRVQAEGQNLSDQSARMLHRGPGIMTLKFDLSSHCVCRVTVAATKVLTPTHTDQKLCSL